MIYMFEIKYVESSNPLVLTLDIDDFALLRLQVVVLHSQLALFLNCPGGDSPRRIALFGLSFLFNRIFVTLALLFVLFLQVHPSLLYLVRVVLLVLIHLLVVYRSRLLRLNLVRFLLRVSHILPNFRSELDELFSMCLFELFC